LVEGRLTKVPPLPSLVIQDHIANLSEFCALLRRRVVRDNDSGKRAIIDTPEAEGTGRLAKNLCMLLMFHSAIFEIEPEQDTAGLAFLERIAYETIPSSKLKFMQSLNLSDETDWSDVRKRTQMPKSTINWLAAELSAQGVIERTGPEEDEDHSCVTYTISNEIADLWRSIKAMNAGTGTKIINIRPHSPSTT